MGNDTGRGRGEDTASSRRIEAAEKRKKALELKKAGATYEQIAERVGFSERGAAHRAVQTALKEVTAEPAREVLQLELERLDAMLLGLWPAARKGKPEAVDRVLKIQERRAKYLGLDAGTGNGLNAVAVENLIEVIAGEDLKNAPRRHPAEVLLDCVHTADVLLTAARTQVERGQATPAALEGLRAALDHAAKWAEKTVALDIASQQQQVFQQVGETYVRLVNRVLEQVVSSLELSEEQRSRAPELVRGAFEVELDRLTAGGGEAA